MRCCIYYLLIPFQFFKYTHLQSNIENVLRDIPLITFKNIFKGVYERPEKYKPKNKTRKIKKNYL